MSTEEVEVRGRATRNPEPFNRADLLREPRVSRERSSGASGEVRARGSVWLRGSRSRSSSSGATSPLEAQLAEASPAREGFLGDLRRGVVADHRRQRRDHDRTPLEQRFRPFPVRRDPIQTLGDEEIGDVRQQPNRLHQVADLLATEGRERGCFRDRRASTSLSVWGAS